MTTMPDRADVATRFSSSRQPLFRSRTSTQWLRDRLNKASRSGSATEREAIVDHLIEVATAWEVRVIGRGADGEVLKVASGRDSVEAAKLLLGYDMGSPTRSSTVLEVAEHIRQVERDRIATVVSLLGHRLRDKTPAQIAEYFNACANDPGKFLELASQAMGQDEPGAVGATQENASPNGCDTASHAPEWKVEAKP